MSSGLSDEAETGHEGLRDSPTGHLHGGAQEVFREIRGDSLRGCHTAILTSINTQINTDRNGYVANMPGGPLEVRAQCMASGATGRLVREAS